MKQWLTSLQKCQAPTSKTKILTLVTSRLMNQANRAIKVIPPEVYAQIQQNKRPVHKILCVKKLEVCVTQLKYLARKCRRQMRNISGRPDSYITHKVPVGRSKSPQDSSEIITGYTDAKKCINAHILAAVKLSKTDLIWKFTWESIQVRSLSNALMDAERDSTTTQTAKIT